MTTLDVYNDLRTLYEKMEKECPYCRNHLSAYGELCPDHRMLEDKILDQNILES